MNDPVCGGKLVTIHACAAALYSDKAHRHWDSAKTVGVDRLRQRIFGALNAYERRLCKLERGPLDVSGPSSLPVQEILTQPGERLHV